VPLPLDEAFPLEAVEDSAHFGSGERQGPDEVLLEDRTAGLDDSPVDPALVARQEPQGRLRRHGTRDRFWNLRRESGTRPAGGQHSAVLRRYAGLQPLSHEDVGQGHPEDDRREEEEQPPQD